LGIPKFRAAVEAQLLHVKNLPKKPWDYKVKFANEPDVNGKPRWEHEVHEQLRRAGIVCITDIMDHVVAESKKVYDGTPAAERFLIYHDGLAQWWEKEAQTYLHEKHNFHDRQLRCWGDTNKGTRYFNKVVGDSPELCRGLDSHGFADLKRSMLYHVAVSSLYSLNDPRRFKMGTPAEVERTMFRCWELAPSSERIVEDIFALETVLDKLEEAGGGVVMDEYLRTGRRERRADGKGELKNKPRARQRKTTLSSANPALHPDCEEAIKHFRKVHDPADAFMNVETVADQ
jgi:hypothetical protein